MTDVTGYKKSVDPVRLQTASEMRLWQRTKDSVRDSGTWERDACLLSCSNETLSGESLLVPLLIQTSDLAFWRCGLHIIGGRFC